METFVWNFCPEHFCPLIRINKIRPWINSNSLSVYDFQLKDTQHPPNINCVDSQGNSCLHCAAYRGHKKCAVLLLQNGIDTNIRNSMGRIIPLLSIRNANGFDWKLNYPISRSNSSEFGTRPANDTNIKREICEKSPKNGQSIGGPTAKTIQISWMATNLGTFIAINHLLFICISILSIGYPLGGTWTRRSQLLSIARWFNNRHQQE